MIITAGPGSSAPFLELQFVFPDWIGSHSALDISGFVLDAEDDMISIFVVPDSDAARLVRLCLGFHLALTSLVHFMCLTANYRDLECTNSTYTRSMIQV
jgi:hypothetical protein